MELSNAIRGLEELEEAIGNLHSVNIRDDSLIVVIDNVNFAIDFASIQELKSMASLLAEYVGKKVALLHLGDSANPLQIRLIKPSIKMSSGGDE